MYCRSTIDNTTGSDILTYTSDDQAIGWTSFDQPEYIEQGSNRLEFTYGHHRQRIRQQLKNGGGETTKTFAGNCEFVSIDGQQYAYTYLSGPTGLFGIHVQQPDRTSVLFYIHTDHLGSLHTITDESGNLLQELSFDAWGNRRNPATWTFFEESPETALFDRGFTGHEHLDGFQLINMNGRLYDPVVSRMLSPDNYVQSPDFSQSFNRYSYAWNNPLVYTDPSGETILLAATYFIFFTDPGYELQKYVLPVAFKVDYGNGTHDKKLGIEVSVGVPKISPFAYRKDFGKTYYWQHISSDYKGWETRKGEEYSVFGLVHWGETNFKSGKFSQTVGFRKIGIPSNIGIDMYNDMWGDGGDRWRTSRTKVNFSPLIGIDINLFTGDPGLNERYTTIINGEETYAIDPGNPYSPDPNTHRAGVFAIRIGVFSIGWDSEAIRDLFQNQIVHNMGGYPYFEDLSKNPNYPQYEHGKFYFQFGW